jgi:hypothetical protein
VNVLKNVFIRVMFKMLKKSKQTSKVLNIIYLFCCCCVLSGIERVHKGELAKKYKELDKQSQ